MTDPSALACFFRGETDWFLQTRAGAIEFALSPPAVLFPGSFNPLHHGHTRLADLAKNRLGLPVAYELSIANPDKPELAPEEVLRRLEQFRDLGDIYVTRSPEFAKKAALFPRTVFVVGADTAARVLHPKYYGDDRGRLLQALEAIRAQGCRFLVGGRLDREGSFVAKDDLAIPKGYHDLFEGVQEAEFRIDISSTELRR